MISGFLGNYATLAEENALLSIRNNGGTLTVAQNNLINVLSIKQTIFITLAGAAVLTTIFSLILTCWYVSVYKKWAYRENMIA